MNVRSFALMSMYLSFFLPDCGLHILAKTKIMHPAESLRSGFFRPAKNSRKSSVWQTVFRKTEGGLYGYPPIKPPPESVTEALCQFSVPDQLSAGVSVIEMPDVIGDPDGTYGLVGVVPGIGHLIDPGAEDGPAAVRVVPAGQVLLPGPDPVLLFRV